MNNLMIEGLDPMIVGLSGFLGSIINLYKNWNFEN